MTAAGTPLFARAGGAGAGGLMSAAARGSEKNPIFLPPRTAGRLYGMGNTTVFDGRRANPRLQRSDARTGQERLLPILLPNSVARRGTRRGAERIGTVKNPI